MIRNKEYLKNYENGIALLFPNLEYSYTYPQSSSDISSSESFLSSHYDNRNYIIVNSIGSFLPLFSYICPFTRKPTTSREFMYMYQYQYKKPYYFLFKFGAEDDEVRNIEWKEGDFKEINEILEGKGERKFNVKVVNVTKVEEKETEKMIEEKER